MGRAARRSVRGRRLSGTQQSPTRVVARQIAPTSGITSAPVQVTLAIDSTVTPPVRWPRTVVLQLHMTHTRSLLPTWALGTSMCGAIMVAICKKRTRTTIEILTVHLPLRPHQLLRSLLINPVGPGRILFNSQISQPAIQPVGPGTSATVAPARKGTPAIPTTPAVTLACR